MTMRMSADGRAQLIRREGFRTKAYKDSVGVWTIGVGHTSAAGEPRVTPGLVITRQEVDEILSRDLRQYEDAVSAAVRVPLTQGQFDALVSFCFNIGTGGFRKSTVVRRLNGGDYKGAAAAFMMWNKPPEIKGRRDSERKQFLAATGAPKSAPAIVQSAASLALLQVGQSAANPMPAQVGQSAANPMPAQVGQSAANPMPAQVGKSAANYAPAQVGQSDVSTEAGPTFSAPPEESVSVDYLRAAGSRTIANADLVKGVAKAVLGADVVDGAARAGDALDRVQEAYVGLQSGAHVLELLRTYWPIPVGLLLALLIAWLAWRAMHAADKITAARVDDALSGLHVGR
jgi:lysozyme